MKNIWIKLLKPSSKSAKWFIFFALLLIVGLIATEQLSFAKKYLASDALSFKLGNYETNLYMVLKTILIVCVVFWTTTIISSVVESRIGKIQGLRPSSRALLVKTIQISVYFFGFVFALDIIGIDLTTLTVFSGALGIGLGFGLQKISSNFISGLILLFEKSVEQDDLIELSDGTFGFVRKARARYTLIETFDGKEIMMPNEDFITSRVVNWTFSNSKGRVEIAIGVSYGADIDKAKELIVEAAKEHPRCSQQDEPMCFLREFGESSVNFILHFWVDDVRDGRWGPQSDVMFAIWHKLKENDIEIPFPQRDLHIKSGLDILKSDK